MSHGAFVLWMKNGYLVELPNALILKKGERAAFTEDDGASWTELPMDAVVSMNMWGDSQKDFFREIKAVCCISERRFRT